jgi:hypothetical protein
LPFLLTEADIDTTPILLQDLPAIRMRLETPAGDVLDPGVVTGFGGTFVGGESLSYYRIALPAPVGAGAHGGVWHALLEVDRAEFKKAVARLDNDPVRARRALAHGVGYSLNVHAFSNIRLAARLAQSSLEPGASMIVRAALREYGIPVERRATVSALLERPDGTRVILPLAEVEPGAFQTTVVAGLSGIYRFRVVATGASLRGLPFTREQLLTGAVFQGGDRPITPGDASDDGDRVCRLVSCLLSDTGVQRFLKGHEIDTKPLLACFERYCRSGHRPERGPADSH